MWRGWVAVGTVLAIAMAVASAAVGDDTATLLESAARQRRAGNIQESIRLAERALILASSSGVVDDQWNARGSLALGYLLAGQLEGAVKLHRENLALARRDPRLREPPMNREVDSLVNLAGVLTVLRRYPQAIASLDEALRKTPSQLGRAKILERIGVNMLQAGDTVRAEEKLEAALRLYETDSESRARLALSPNERDYEPQVSVLRWLQLALVRQNRTDEALAVSERGRSRAFAALLAGRLAGGVVRPLPPPPDVVRIRQIARDLGATLVQYAIVYEDAPALPLQFSGYRDVAPAAVFIWVIRPTGQIAFRRVPLPTGGPTLVDLVLQTREALGERGRAVKIVPSASSTSPLDRALRRLHAVLIEPVAGLLPREPGARVVFLPQDVLLFVPFAALTDGTGQRLVERHTIVTAPSLQVLELTHQGQKRHQDRAAGVLVVGNPTMPAVGPDGGRLENLPGAEREAREVARLYGARAMTGDQATKAAVTRRMATARVVHLATHGILDDVEGLLGAIALAPSPGDGGLLTAREMIALDLVAELVVLSACDTGTGRLTGDGIVGMSRSLLAAGAASVLVSLWAVPDDPTVLLMTELHRRLKTGADKAEALRGAMLATMKRYPNPRDWAAFVLIGDPSASPSLRAVSGDSQLAALGPTSRYTVLPLPSVVLDYREWPSTVPGERDVTFDSPMSPAELVTFYRESFARAGLRELMDLASLGNDSFQLVFARTGTGRIIVVQGSRSGRGLLVSVRQEPARN